ncbi:general transcription factor 3C polypeptide 1, partial [Biomphalaria pfeifferi]
VFKVGIVTRRFVSRRNVRIWMIEVIRTQPAGTLEPCDTRSQNVLYQCRLWRKYDGQLNHEGLKLILIRVLTYLMLHPGCTVSKACYDLNPDILPASTMDAIDILELLDCIKLTRVAKMKPPDMFSTRVRNVAHSDGLMLQDSDIYIEVLTDGPVKLSYFLDYVEQYATKVVESSQ